MTSHVPHGNSGDDNSNGQSGPDVVRTCLFSCMWIERQSALETVTAPLCRCEHAGVKCPASNAVRQQVQLTVAPNVTAREVLQFVSDSFESASQSSCLAQASPCSVGGLLLVFQSTGTFPAFTEAGHHTWQ